MHLNMFPSGTCMVLACQASNWLCPSSFIPEYSASSLSTCSPKRLSSKCHCLQQQYTLAQAISKLVRVGEKHATYFLRLVRMLVQAHQAKHFSFVSLGSSMQYSSCATHHTSPRTPQSSSTQDSNPLHANQKS